jgi:hypothetical protein
MTSCPVCLSDLTFPKGAPRVTVRFDQLLDVDGETSFYVALRTALPIEAVLPRAAAAVGRFWEPDDQLLPTVTGPFYGLDDCAFGRGRETWGASAGPC